ncbi:unnamed protein product [Rotaria socialis]|uniref:Ig-like domain-containing protein n=1 Tax=Rotaria socialis TaxID=392032 RepID=A0A818W6H7_9BILA|nr:unnamed protein product [Rotaria socialis]CAF3643253.1 unnamed protein product [Rotaria socialis]CAF3721012.1 unnamed protein product [Rotaria socialis]
MDWYLWYYLFISPLYVTIIADTSHIRTIDVQQDERVRLECTVTSKLDAEEAMWMRIRAPHNPDILTYRDSVVYAPDRIQLEQRVRSSIDPNGTFMNTYYLTLTILRPTTDDEGRYLCSRTKNIFAEYDLFIIVPPQFVDDNSFFQQRSIIEGSTLQLSCSASGRPKPSITWLYRTNDRKHVPFGDGTSCQDTVCELHIANYSRNDPTTIECVADNEKSTRISKVFNVDVFYPPKLSHNVQTFTGTKSIEILIQCSSTSNPPTSIVWLDHNREQLYNSTIFSIKTMNQSSILSFFAYPQKHPSHVFYCHSDNAIGTDEKLINISKFVQLDSLIIRETTTPLPTSFTTQDLSQSKKQKTVRPSRARSKSFSATTETLNNATTISSSTHIIYSFSNNVFYIVLSLVVFCF